MGEAEPRWMTYRALADELGISLRAAEARARRNVRMGRWRHRIDNEPPKAAQVLVPPAEGERDALREALRAAQTTAEEAGRRARTAEDRAAAAHLRAGEITAVMGRVAEGLEHLRQAQVTAAEAVAAAEAEREAALARVEETAQRAGEAEARVAEASRRAEAAEARLDELQRLPVEAIAPDTAELEAAQARVAEAERQAAKAQRRADEAERKATVANERWDRFQQKRIAEAQEVATRAASTAQVTAPEAEVRPLWHRIFRRRASRAT